VGTQTYAQTNIKGATAAGDNKDDDDDKCNNDDDDYDDSTMILNHPLWSWFALLCLCLFFLHGCPDP
jgi:hypothetical protein